ncbi:MAG: B12-binding domain-containing radical SAM protein [Hyphomicrobiales bacterium]|nr:B12-binding domain-containing radical SAM protein [Hyphomicrobiales bacterium]
MQTTTEAMGIGYLTPPLGLLTVAALLPETWQIRFVDRNVGKLRSADLEWADLVMSGGMLPQQRDLLTLISLAHAHGKPIVVGGADVTSSPHIYCEADFQVLGEAEDIIDDFVSAFENGAASGVFEGEKYQVDVTKTPIPRYDLLDLDAYIYIGVQFSRGCPFTCEFCDIIELFGRVPRTKSIPQVFAELDTLYELGYRGHVDFVDDNLIGNKKSVRKFLPELVKWQEARNFPFGFSTEASINLADEEILLKQMHAANFFAIFVGLESPDPVTLSAMKKKQNTRRDLVSSVQTLFDAGLYVVGSFVIGFDSEEKPVAESIVQFVEAAALPVAMVSLLYALPNTQLTKRLAAEGRLHNDYDRAPDASMLCQSGINFVPNRPREEILGDIVEIWKNIYDPDAFFDRVRRMTELLSKKPRKGGTRLRELKRFLRLVLHIAQQPELRWRSLKAFIYGIRRNPAAIDQIMLPVMGFVHVWPYSRKVIAKIEAEIESLGHGTGQSANRPKQTLLKSANAGAR